MTEEERDRAITAHLKEHERRHKKREKARIARIERNKQRGMRHFIANLTREG